MEPTETSETGEQNPTVAGRAKKQWPFWSFLILVLILLGFWLFAPRPAASPQPTSFQAESIADVAPQSESSPTDGKATLTLNPSTTTIRDGDNFTVTAVVDPVKNSVNGAELEVHFNSQQLELKKVEPSAVFSLELGKADIDNDQGTAKFAYGVPLGDTPVNAATPVATLTFVAKVAKGLSEIVVDSRSLVAAVGITTNVLASTSPAVVEITP